MNAQEMEDRVAELAASWINGNRKWVAAEIFETEGADAIELVLAMHEALPADQMAILLRLIAILQEGSEESELCETCGMRFREGATEYEEQAEHDDPNDHSWITPEMFDEKLSEMAHRASVAEILALPGVLEICREELNNEIIAELEDER